MYLTDREVVHDPTPVGDAAPRRGTERPADHTLADLERDHIAQVLDECDGNKARAARCLGRRSLYRRIERYGLDLTARGTQA